MVLIIFFYFFYTPFKIFFWNTYFLPTESDFESNIIPTISVLTSVTLGVLFFDIFVSLNSAFHQNGVL